MGFFRNLWDEALAGPTSDSGVGKFRRYNSLLSRRSNIGDNADENIPVSRSITILRTNSLSSSGSSSPAASSPTGSTTAGSPFSATSTSPGGGELKKLTRRKSTADAANRRESKSPTGYDWIVLTSLDR